MLIKDAWSYFSSCTTKASEILRQLALAGIAVVWIFKNDARADHSQMSVPNDFYWPAVIMIVTLFVDLLQYVVGGVLWGAYARLKELQAKDTKPGESVVEIPDAPIWINRVPLCFFWTKLATLCAGYALLFNRLWPHLSLTP